MRLKRKLSSIGSANAKTLTKNFSALAVLQAMRYLIPFIVLPYVTPIIGVTHFGEIAVAYAIALIFQTVVNFSFDFIGARDVARNREDMEKVSEIVSTILCARIVLYVIAFVLLGGIVLAVPKFREIWLLILISVATAFFSMNVSEWFFQGIEKMEHITIVNVISRVVYIVLIFTFIKEREDYLLYPIFNLLGFVMASMYSIVMMTRKYKCRLHIPPFSKILDSFNIGKDLFVNQVCMSLCINLPNILLGTISGSAAAGLYDAAGKLHNAGKHSIDVLNRTFFPFLSRQMDKHTGYRRINFFFSLLLAVLLFFLAPLLIRLLYSDEFLPAIPLLRILAVSVFFTGISSAYGVNYLLLIGREKLLRNITLTVTLLGVVLFVVLTYLYSTVGAAVAVVILNAAFALSYFTAARRCTVPEISEK
ncbi:MAG: oligosaccharide flippase family protein [Bacteroidales bacterium]|nr:oligosaccharide flippase family protein [Bacteroidales bacterium]